MADPTDIQRGDLKSHPLPTLFMDLGAMRATGTLALSHDGYTRTIHFEEGRLIFAASTDPNDRLGEVLIRQGKLSFSDHQRAIKKLRPGVRLGAILVGEKIIPSEALVGAVLSQVRSIVLGCFTWERGEFEFTPRRSADKEVIRLDLEAREIVREGMFRIENAAAVMAGVGDLESGWRLTPECEARLEGWKLGDAENRILASLGETKSFAQLSTLRAMHDFDLARFLWCLQVLGIVQPVNDADSSLDAMMDDAFGAQNKSAAQPAKPAAPVPVETVLAAARPDGGHSTQELPATHAPAEELAANAAVDETPAAPAAPEFAGDDFEDDAGFTADDLEFGAGTDKPAIAAPSAPETVRKTEAPADEISRALADFGVRHKKIIAILGEKSAEKTGSFVGFCLREVRKSHPRLFQGMEPDTAGELPLDKLLGNIRTQKLANYSAGFHDLHDVLTRRARTWQGMDTARLCRDLAGLPPFE